MDNIINDISESMISRYSDRYKRLGYDVKTLGWGSKEQQIYRFEQTLTAQVDFCAKTILDIGCGFGDYYKFLSEKGVNFDRYIGWDLNDDLINESKRVYPPQANLLFEVQNIAAIEPKKSAADVGVMLGLLNLNLKGKIDNYEYSQKLISTAFQLVNEVLIVDFLSSSISLDYPKEDFVYYHEPSKMLEFALTLTSNVELRHNYMPIPQKEFMLFIYK